MAVILIPLCALGLFLAYSRLYKRAWSRGLSCELAFDRDCLTEGEECSLQEIMTNEKKLPLLFLQVKFSLKKGLYAKDYPNASLSDRTYISEVFSLRPYERVKRTLKLMCEKRGFYTLERADLSGVNLLAGEKSYMSLPQSTSVYVFPRRLAVSAITLPLDRIMGEVQRRSFLYEDPFTFRGVRDYMSFDPMKSINWKITAKTGELKVNQMDSSTSRQVIILLNLFAPPALFDSELFEDGIRLAMTIATELSSRQVSTAIYTNGRDALTGRPFFSGTGLGGSHLQDLAKGLSRIDLDSERSEFSQAVEQALSDNREGRAAYCIISTSTREEICAGAGRIRETGAIPLWLCPKKRSMETPLAMDGVDFQEIVTR